MAVSILKQIVNRLVTVVKVNAGFNNRADIVLSADNGAERIILPVVPAELPTVNSPQNNEQFNTVLGDVSVIGTLGNRELTIESLLPLVPSKCSFARPYGSTPDEVINFIKKYQNEYIPFRLTITYSDGAVYLNMACLVNDFSYYQDKVGDYHYSLQLVEYKMVTPLGGLSS